MITVADLIAYRRRNDKLVRRVVSTRLPTAFGDFDAVGYRSLVDGKHHVALVKGDVVGERGRARAGALRVPHRRRLPLAALRLRRAARIGAAMIEREGRGVLLYLSPGGSRHRPAEQAARLRAAGGRAATRSRPTSASGCPADLRDYGIGAQILVDLGLSSIRILTNNPKKIRGLEGYGLSVSAQIPIEHAPNEHNEAYLRTKAERMGHTLHHQGLNLDAELLRPERGQGERGER